MKTQPTAGTYTETWRMNSSVPDGNQPIGDNVTVQIVVPTPVLPNAQYISETVPPGTSEPVNTSFTETVTMKNTGNTTWITGINGYTLNLLTTAQFGETGSPIYAQLNQSSVAPGSNGTFTISMKTQPTAGTYTENLADELVGARWQPAYWRQRDGADRGADADASQCPVHFRDGAAGHVGAGQHVVHRDGDDEEHGQHDLDHGH